MELSLKSKTIKKRHKKKKNRIPASEFVPLVKPEAFDGISNWLRIQKIIEPVKEKSEKETKKNMLKVAEIQNCKGFGSFSQKSRNDLRNPSQNDLKNADKYFDSKLLVKSGHSETTKANHNKSFTFNFNESTDNSPNKMYNFEEKRNKFAEKKLTKAVAMDCEMVGIGPKGEESIIARVSIVNTYGVCLYDEFVKPKEKVTDFRTKISGVRPSDLKKGKDLFEVQRDVLNIIEGRILVGHSIKHDLDVLFISHPRHLIRDTAHYKPFRDICGGRTPSLKKLTSRILGCDIQSGEHNSIEDAQATMLLYLRQKQEWEKEVKSQRKRKPKLVENQTKIL